ncbi:MAG: 30S ribosome-binding factor RbfA [Dehalococcoidales bacterium]
MAYRVKRVNQLIRKEISELLQREVNDPRLSSFVSVNEVDTSPDLKQARIYVSHLGSSQDKDEIMAALTAAAGYFRSELARSLKMRNTPVLEFRWDDSIERGAHILELIDKVTRKQEQS